MNTNRLKRTVPVPMYIGIGIGILILAASGCGFSTDGPTPISGKIRLFPVCHCSPDGCRSLELPRPALHAHLDHGDKFGYCVRWEPRPILPVEPRTP